MLKLQEFFSSIHVETGKKFVKFNFTGICAKFGALLHVDKISNYFPCIVVIWLPVDLGAAQI
jgi:hypothetical protein